MASVHKIEIELLGVHAGANMEISGHTFVNGKTVLIDADQFRLNQAARLFSYFGGYEVGSPEWQARKDELSGVHNSKSGKEGSGSLSGDSKGGDDESLASDVPNGKGLDGDGAASAGSSGTTGSAAPSRYDPSQMKKLADAIKKLNPEVDEHWTDGGLPRLKALETAGFHGVNREAVETAAAGWTREKALAESV